MHCGLAHAVMQVLREVSKLSPEASQNPMKIMSELKLKDKLMLTKW